MNTIWKFYLNANVRKEIEIPEGAQFLRAGTDPNNRLCLWYLVDSEASTTMRSILIIGTGHMVPDVGPIVHLGSCVQDEFVWHIFEIV